jgi:predicted Zn-dependent protease
MVKQKMKRGQWKFAYSGAALAIASQIKVDYHKSRLEFWENRQKEVEEQIQKSGIKIDKSQLLRIANNTSQGFSASNAYSRQSTVEIDETMLRDLNECIEKVRGHRQLFDDYRGWLQLFNAQKDSTLKLHHDDYLYFFDERRKLGEEEKE